MEARLAVLEEIAKSTKEALGEIRADLRGLRQDQVTELRGLRQDQRSDVRWLIGLVIAATGVITGVMIRGFHWL